MSIIQDALNKPKDAPGSDGDDGVMTSPKGKETGAAVSIKKEKGINALFNIGLRSKSIALFFYILAGTFFVIYIFTLFLFPAPRHTVRLADGRKMSAPVVRPAAAAPVSQAAAPVNVFRPRSRFPGFILNGIMQLVDGPRAIINNVIVGIGDVIGGAKVKNINKDNVVLQTPDSEITLKMR